MKVEIKAAIYMLGIIVVIGLSIAFGRTFYFPKMPAFLPIGTLIIGIFFGLDCLVEICRGKTNQIISNIGHWSINTSKDIHQYPWHDSLLSKAERKKKTIGTLTFMFPGGVDYYGISMKSSSACPVYIFPSKFLEKEENNYHVNANLYKKNLDELSPYYQNILKKHYKHRVKNSTPIYFGGTSHLDGSDTLENLKIEFEREADNKEYTSLSTKLDHSYKELDRYDEHKRKRLVIGREIKPLDEEA